MYKGFDGSYVECGGKTKNGEKSYSLRKWIGGTVPNFQKRQQSLLQYVHCNRIGIICARIERYCT